MATPSDSTVEGGPGLALDNLLDVPCNNVNLGGDCRRVLSVQCLPLVLPELVFGDEHVGNLVLDVLEGGEGSLRRVLRLTQKILRHPQKSLRQLQKS